jgi:hypothetical protein
VSDVPTQEERRPDRAALVIAVLLGGLAAVIAIGTYNMQQGVASYSRVGPRAFPYVIAACIGLIALATLRAALRGEFPVREKDEIKPILLRSFSSGSPAASPWRPAPSLRQPQWPSAAGRSGSPIRSA